MSEAELMDGVQFINSLNEPPEMIYIDPPFGHGTFGGDFELCIALAQAALGRMPRDGVVYFHCDPRLLWKVAKAGLPQPRGVIAWKNGWVSGFKSKSILFWPRQYQTIVGWAGDDWKFTPVLDEARGGKKRRGSDIPTRPMFSDWWETPNPVDQCSFGREKLGWPTQKPVELLTRLIMGSTHPGGLVADPCCGSGTSRRAALAAGRRWRGCDIDPRAVSLANKAVARAAEEEG
jgi:hypothetical protein